MVEWSLRKRALDYCALHVYFELRLVSCRVRGDEMDLISEFICKKCKDAKYCQKDVDHSVRFSDQNMLGSAAAFPLCGEPNSNENATDGGGTNHCTSYFVEPRRG